jgi:hypothetical protein
MEEQQLEQGYRIFDATLARSKEMIARGLDPVAVVSGLLTVAVEIARETIGPRQTRAMLMAASDATGDDDLDA